MPKVRLTPRTLDRLRQQGRWLTDYWDEGLPRFGVRVSPSGRKTFVVRYEMEGRRRRLTLGTHPVLGLADARLRAIAALAAIEHGLDPSAEPTQEREPTFDELATEYLERHAKRKKRRWREDERILRVDLLPAWRERSVTTIQRRDVADVLDRIVERGAPIMANRTKALISKVFNFGLSRDLVGHNPCLGVPMPAKARQRDRVLSEGEIRRVWHTAERESVVMAATFKMRLLTAQRAGEVLAMRWDEIDGDTWTIPAERSKNGYTHVVPLSSAARDLLDQLEPLTGQSPWVFESPKPPGTHIVSIQKAAYRISDRAGVAFVPHDLRRTAATSMASMGVPRLVIAKILNHVDRSVTAIYERHRYDSEKREALERWARESRRSSRPRRLRSRTNNSTNRYNRYEKIPGQEPHSGATTKPKYLSSSYLDCN